MWHIIITIRKIKSLKLLILNHYFFATVGVSLKKIAKKIIISVVISKNVYTKASII